MSASAALRVDWGRGEPCGQARRLGDTAEAGFERVQGAPYERLGLFQLPLALQTPTLCGVLSGTRRPASSEPKALRPWRSVRAAGRPPALRPPHRESPPTRTAERPLVGCRHLVSTARRGGRVLRAAPEASLAANAEGRPRALEDASSRALNHKAIKAPNKSPGAVWPDERAKPRAAVRVRKV